MAWIVTGKCTQSSLCSPCCQAAIQVRTLKCNYMYSWLLWSAGQGMQIPVFFKIIINNCIILGWLVY
jgi:hypothetical protein